MQKMTREGAVIDGRPYCRPCADGHFPGAHVVRVLETGATTEDDEVMACSACDASLSEGVPTVRDLVDDTLGAIENWLDAHEDERRENGPEMDGHWAAFYDLLGARLQAMSHDIENGAQRLN